MKLRRLTLVLCALLSLPALWEDEAAAGEPDAALRAADLLRPDVLRGPSYVVEDAVAVRDHHYVFRITTRWGEITADGLPMLGLRLNEMEAIERAERFSRDPQFIGGLVESASQTPRGVGVLLTDPVGAVLGIPRGIKRNASTKLHPADRRAGSVTRRRLAYDVGCDPETTNPVLKPLLDNLATRKGLGQLAGKVGMSAVVPGLGLVPLTAEMQNSLLVKLPHEINAEIDLELQAMGVDEKTREAFLTSPHFTTGQRLILMSQLDKLRHAENRAAIVEIAARARSEADALSANDQLRMLIDLDGRQTIACFEDAGVPVAVLKEGGCVVVCSVDYVTASADLSAMLGHFRKRHPEAPALLVCSGRISPAARQMLAEAGVSATELR